MQRPHNLGSNEDNVSSEKTQQMRCLAHSEIMNYMQDLRHKVSVSLISVSSNMKDTNRRIKTPWVSVQTWKFQQKNWDSLVLIEQMI